MSYATFYNANISHASLFSIFIDVLQKDFDYSAILLSPNSISLNPFFNKEKMKST